MVVSKRCLLWDYTNTSNLPDKMDIAKFDGPMCSVSNWNAWYPPELKGRAPFRPMIRVEQQLHEEWQVILNSDQPIIHFFNEPERAGISPKKAAAYWHDQVVPILRNERGKKLVSPSCASDPRGQAWIKEFMSLVQDARPDYLGLHWYGIEASECRNFITKMHDEFQLPIIVSEIASIDRSYLSVHAFTRDMCNWMDGIDWIIEYGFFGCMQTMPNQHVSEEARLMDRWGNFTDLMWKYMSDQPMF